jgi:hypothetical protein
VIDPKLRGDPRTDRLPNLAFRQAIKLVIREAIGKAGPTTKEHESA